jgi:hypothetical protein
MKIYTKIFIIFTWLVFAYTLNTNVTFAQTASTSTSTLTELPLGIIPTSTTQSVTPTTTPPLIEKIVAAKNQLLNINLNLSLVPVYKKNSGKLLRYELGSKDIALAILDPVTNNIIITTGKQNGKSMNFEQSLAKVKLTKFNGVNSKFKVELPENGIVLALKYFITPTESGLKTKIENDAYQVTYTPFSENLNQQGVVEYGEKYLNDVLTMVNNDLFGLPSHSIPGKTITDAIPISMIKSLIYAEHTDTYSALNNNLDSSINQLNILLATNLGDTYKYSVSSAGARGIAQFMPGTYKSLVKRHPSANLIEDFTAGMSDHKNAIKAMYLLLDDYAGTVRIKTTNGFLENKIFEYGAASYNGGTTRVIKAINTLGNNWHQDPNEQKIVIQKQINSITADIAKLKSEIKNPSNSPIKPELQERLKTLQKSLAEQKKLLAALKNIGLRNETVNYLKKIYTVIQHFESKKPV